MDTCFCNQNDDCDNPLYCDTHAENESPTKTKIVVKNEEQEREFKLLLGNALFREQACLVIEVEGAEQALNLSPGKETLFGRFDSNGTNPTHVDLTPYGGRQKGVSRLHAAIYRARHTLSLADLDSANGTYLNGERLRPQQSRVLRDGDEIRFGELAARVRFQQAPAQDDPGMGT